MTFKELLTKKADEACTNIDVSENINRVKDKLDGCCTSREFFISLIRPKTAMVIGSSSDNCASFFIPPYVSPHTYKDVFVSALNELGFTNDDMIISYTDLKNHAEFNIKLTW